jgi:P-aminobenzoate N-oxygenase AurF
LAPFLGLVAGPFKVVFFISILAGEEPLDHIQKAVLRDGVDVPPALRRIMAIHVAEEARHISFAHEFLRQHVPRQTHFGRLYASVAFPIAMRWLANVYLVPPRSLARDLGIPRRVIRGAFWRNPQSRRILSDYFADVRMLATELGLMNSVARLVWKLLLVDGPASRYRGEPRREARDTT